MVKNTPSSTLYLDHMGDDTAVVDAARVSFNKESVPLHTMADFRLHEGKVDDIRKAKGLSPINYDARYDAWYGYVCDQFLINAPALNFTDFKLIDFLARNDHFTPFGHAVVKFRIKAPVFVARQLVKHQIGLCWNEVSRRYVDTEPDFYPIDWRARPDKSIKQGSSSLSIRPEPLIFDAVPADDPTGHVSIQINPEGFTELALALYLHLLNENVSPELARTVLPLNHMTEWVWTGSLLAWARVANLRLDPHAQRETSEVAAGIALEMNQRFPVSWKALTQKG